MAKGFSRATGSGSGGMMQHIQRLQQQLAEAQAQLAEETVTGTTGGGAVRITMTGDQKCRSVKVSAQLLLSAVNQALEQSRALASERLGPLTGGVPF